MLHWRTDEPPEIAWYRLLDRTAKQTGRASHLESATHRSMLSASRQARAGLCPRDVRQAAHCGARRRRAAGGLSGAPVRDKSTSVIRQLTAELQGALPIIGVGGILSGVDAAEKIHAGATLVQIYSGLIYRGPALVAESCTAIRAI